MEMINYLETLNKSRNDLADVIREMVANEIEHLMDGVDEIRLTTTAGVVYDNSSICYVHTVYTDKDRNDTICVKGSFGLMRDVDVDCGLEEIDLDGQVAVVNSLYNTINKK